MTVNQQEDSFAFHVGDFVVPIKYEKSSEISNRWNEYTARNHLFHYIKIKGRFMHRNGIRYYSASDSFYAEEDLMLKEDYLCSKNKSLSKFNSESLNDLL